MMVSFAPIPDDESMTINGAWLHSGRQIRRYRSGPAVAWATGRAVPHPGMRWRLIAEESATTGLQPILLSGLDGSTERPWDRGEFDTPGDLADIDLCDVARLLADGWAGQEPSADQLEADGAEWWADYSLMFEPYVGDFPGLASRIGLVPAARPADVLTRLGWTGVVNRGWGPAQVSAVLRSWEDRFGARLLEVGFADIRLVVSRPPRTLDEALPIAAEHVAFCDECARMGLRDVRTTAQTLVGLARRVPPRGHTRAPAHPRTCARITRFFDGLQSTEAGIVDVHQPIGIGQHGSARDTARDTKREFGLLGQHPGAHPPRGRPAGPGLRLAAVPPARRGV
jgi:Domain of unknown function (DUF4253)